MSGGLPAAVLITLVGMGLVFAAILAFWLLMALLTRWTSDRQTNAGGDGGDAEQEQRRRAAVAAVTVAMAMDADERPGSFAVPPTAVISTWQAVMRARHLGQRRSVQ